MQLTIERSLSSSAIAYAKLTQDRLSRRSNESFSLTLTRMQVMGILTALEMHAKPGTPLDPALQSLRETLKNALQQMSV